MDNSEHHTTQIIVGNFLRDFLNEQGYQWNPPLYSATGVFSSNDRSSLAPSVSERKVIDSLLFAARKMSTNFNQSLNSTARDAGATSNLAYDYYTDIADELFAQSIEWCHILTLFVFTAKLAVTLVQNGGLRSSGGTLTQSQTFNMLYNWLVTYISSKVSIALWIRSHGSWNGFVDYANSLSPPSLYSSVLSKLTPFSCTSLKPLYALGASIASIAAITAFWMVNKDASVFKKWIPTLQSTPQCIWGRFIPQSFSICFYFFLLLLLVRRKMHWNPPTPSVF